MDQFALLARVAEIIEYHHSLMQRNGDRDQCRPLGAGAVAAAIRQALRESGNSEEVVRKNPGTT